MRGEIRQFLTTRRAKITPEQAGLRFYGANRRVPGLRREEVALLAGISIEYYTRLERGNATGVSGEVLDAIARALQLDDVERAPHRPGQDGEHGPPGPPPRPAPGPPQRAAGPGRDDRGGGVRA